MGLTKSGVLDLMKQGWNGPVMAENQVGGWKTAADFGIVIQVAQPPPPVPTTPAAPTPPPLPATPSFQQGFTQQGPATPPTSTAVPTTGNASKLTPEKQARLDSYIAAISSGQTLQPDQLADYANMVRESQV